MASSQLVFPVLGEGLKHAAGLSSACFGAAGSLLTAANGHNALLLASMTAAPLFLSKPAARAASCCSQGKPGEHHHHFCTHEGPHGKSLCPKAKRGQRSAAKRAASSSTFASMSTSPLMLHSVEDTLNDNCAFQHDARDGWMMSIGLQVSTL